MGRRYPLYDNHPIQVSSPDKLLSAAFSLQTGPPFSLGGSKPCKLTHTDFDLCYHTAHVALVCRLNGFYIRNLCKYMGYYSFSDPGRMEG